MEILKARHIGTGHGHVSGDNIIHLSAEMTGNRREDTKRRAQAIEFALLSAAGDPLVAVRMAFGRAYGEVHAGISRNRIVHDLRELLTDPALHAAAVGWQSQLRNTVAARTQGDKCGDYIGQVQLALLDEVLIPTEGPPDAA